MHTSEGQLLFILTGISLLLSGLIGYFLFSMVRQFKRYRRQQDRYSLAKLEALEQERMLIAADLHDDIGPLLSAIMYKLGVVHPVAEREIKMLTEARSHIEGIFSRLRDMSTMLMPRGIEKKGPFYALHEFCDSYLKDQELQVEISRLTVPGLDGYRSLHLFRILQEILHNTMKHAGANRLCVEGRIEGEVLYIETRDDGRGFDPSAMQGKRGLGLEHLLLRADMIGAFLNLHSWPGMGTRYEIEVPLAGQRLKPKRLRFWATK